MTVFLVMVVVIVVLLLFLVLAICACLGQRKEKIRLGKEIERMQGDLDYYLGLERIKKEGLEKYNEKSKELHSGDVHGRNSAAATILRNGKN